eukprot:TRINITY_DN10220_c0_g1_i1.p1 TRINITY_DN10220_c0_g1~~TRINITY_DN10220_c0_g1_i1.p1  ORF type:complete len:387 (+),score=71.42 TRINITY_DN10220_c0_g1_i1:1-1161(+)
MYKLLSVLLFSLCTITLFFGSVKGIDITNILESTVWERIEGNTTFQFTEGPVYAHDDLFLYFSDITASTIYAFDTHNPNEFYDYQHPTNKSNGLKFDKNKRLLACRHESHAVTRQIITSPNVEVLADEWEGDRLNSPNDLCIRSDGTIYFTDPTYGVDPIDRKLNFSGVYRIIPDSNENQLELLLTDLVTPNGIVFSPDERFLYIADTSMGYVVRYIMDTYGNIINPDGEIFCNVSGPDGLAVDRQGNLYVAATTGLRVYTPNGVFIGEAPKIDNPQPSNLAFGDPDMKGIYITARDGIYRLQGRVPGTPTYGVVIDSTSSSSYWSEDSSSGNEGRIDDLEDQLSWIKVLTILLTVLVFLMLAVFVVIVVVVVIRFKKMRSPYTEI